MLSMCRVDVSVKRGGLKVFVCVLGRSERVRE